MSQPTIQIGLRWQSHERTCAVPVPPEQSTLLDLLPAARALAHDATAMALEQVRSEGKEISCCAGCGACCRQLVAISMIEAVALADLVDSMPPERQVHIRRRFADATTRLEEAGLLESHEPKGERALLARDLGERTATLQGLSRRYFELGIPCPFLEDESCSIHPDRPIVCREHHVTTPAENCAKLFQAEVERVEPALRVGEALARTANRVGGHGGHMVPLVLSLEFAETHGAALKETRAGQVLLHAMIEELSA